MQSNAAPQFTILAAQKTGRPVMWAATAIEKGYPRGHHGGERLWLNMAPRIDSEALDKEGGLAQVVV